MSTVQRYDIEEKEKWREWIAKIPAINFPSEWAVKVIPPFCGAMARFLVQENGKTVSVYLDCHAALGACTAPYWEIYPYDDDTFRCAMNDVDELLGAIRHSLKTMP
jgi:hypothetical protein